MEIKIFFISLLCFIVILGFLSIIMSFVDYPKDDYDEIDINDSKYILEDDFIHNDKEDIF